MMQMAKEYVKMRPFRGQWYQVSREWEGFSVRQELLFVSKSDDKTTK